MKTLIIILFISLLAALMMTPSVGVSPGTEVYTKEMWHKKMCIQPKYKTLPECQVTEDNSAAIAGIIGQM